MQNEQMSGGEYAATSKIEQIEATEINPTPDNPPWSGFAALGVWIASVIFISVFPLLFLIPYLAGKNADFSDRASILELLKSDTSAILWQLAAIFPAHLFTLILAWAVVTRFNRFSFKETLGWNWGGFKFWHLIAALIFCYGIGLLLVGIFGQKENELQMILQSSRTAVYLVAFFATFTAPLVEEIVYRGVLYSAFQRRLGQGFAVALVTLLFAAVHVPQYYPNFATILTILIVSLVLTLIRVRTKNLLPCIVLHTVFNGVQSILLVLEPYLKDFAAPHQNEIPALIRFLM